MYDLIIVGGGPAGASAGRTAGRLGLRTLLLEKEVFPRYKPCGGAVSARAMAYLDFPLPPEMRERALSGARIHYRGHTVEGHLPMPYASLVLRSAFDALLLARAEEIGIEVHQGEKALGVLETGEGVTVRTPHGEYAGRFAVIAEGSQGLLKGRVRRRDTREEQGIGVVTEIPAQVPRGDAADIHFGVARWGYGWVFPHGDHLSVGVGGLLKCVPQIREIMRTFLRDQGLAEDGRYRGHTIPAGGMPRSIANGRILLAGDAAGFADPLSGEGIAYAIRSGQLAARSACRAVSGQEDAIAGYEAACEREFGRELRDALFLARLVFRFPGVFFRFFSSHPRVVQAYLEVVAGTRSYRGFMAWAFPRLPWYLALRAVGFGATPGKSRK